MTISTMEELEALAPGTSVKVTGRRLGERIFERTRTGFAANGVEVEPRFFAGHVEAGQVVNFSHGDPEPGDHYVAGVHRYVIVSVTDDGVTIMQFSRGRWQNMIRRPMTETRGFTWTRVAPEQRPEWHDMAYALGAQMSGVQAESARVAQQWNEAQRELGQMRVDLARMRETRAAQIQVVATGVTRLPVDKAAGHVPEDTTVVDVVASWRREFTVTSEPATGCQCGTISREQVIGLLGISGQSEHADFGFQVNCGRH